MRIQSLIFCAIVVTGCSQTGVPSALPANTNASPASSAVRGATSSADFRIIYFFKGVPDGGNSFVGLTPVNGVLYGTTFLGGENENGTYFEVTPEGQERVLYHFQGGYDGSRPYASLIYSNGKFFGTTASGGGGPCQVLSYGVGCGTVFTVDPVGRERVLYRFQGSTSGAIPQATLLYYRGDLYGTTAAGGVHGAGSIFKIGAGGAQNVIYSFQSGDDGYFPVSKLIAVDGVLYGTTQYGGGGGCPKGCGTVFKVTTSGQETVIHRFKNGGYGGTNPWANLVAMGDTLYGTTLHGGGNGCVGSGGAGCGVIFEMSTTGREHTLHAFGSGAMGGNSMAALTPVKGSLYGVASWSGTTCRGGLRNTCGALFKVTTSGQYSVIHMFNGADGSYPVGALVLMKGRLYGTTLFGGNSGCYENRGCGTVFEVKP
ncbi:MAG: hypothetical protein JO199_05160 [Candidatus Eremiobacteraeota bacterium]|nr:hypothetical protein [Candidatus Eremiobacteraeota bacterium]